MNDRSPEEILRFTFSRLDAVLREKRMEKDRVRGQSGGRTAEVEAEEETTLSGAISGTDSEGH